MGVCLSWAFFKRSLVEMDFLMKNLGRLFKGFAKGFKMVELN